MHPIQAQLEGKDQIDWQDSQGKQIFVGFIKVRQEEGSGWVDYWWPKPGDNPPAHKVPCFTKAKVNGEDLVVGRHIYDQTDEEIAKLLKQWQ